MYICCSKFHMIVECAYFLWIVECIFVLMIVDHHSQGPEAENCQSKHSFRKASKECVGRTRTQSANKAESLQNCNTNTNTNTFISGKNPYTIGTYICTST